MERAPGCSLVPTQGARYPIIILTASDSEPARTSLLAAGAIDCVVKSPASLRALPRILQRVLRQWEQILVGRRAEEELRLHSRALEAVANAVLMTDRKGHITWANPAFTRLTGYELDEVVGQNPHILKSGWHDHAFYQQLWNTILSGQVWFGQMVNRRKDGVLYDAELTITPVRDDAGTISHFIAVKQDVTERYRAEAKLREYAFMLQDTNRNLEEARRSAEAAREEAEHASLIKSEFLAKMSHELRTPLNSIIGFTELMLADTETPHSPKSAKRLEKVHRNGRHLLALINDILDLSKIEAKGLTLDLAPVDIAALLGDCVESARPLIKSSDVRLEQDIDLTLSEAGPLLADEVRVRQIVMNLLSNAAKFTESGYIELKARTACSELVIEVSDTGVGIVGTDLSRIFKEFEQADSSTTRRAGGTGLGLAICERLCSLMGGSIGVASTSGQGTCFTVRLPLRSAAEAAVECSSADSSGVHAS